MSLGIEPFSSRQQNQVLPADELLESMEEEVGADEVLGAEGEFESAMMNRTELTD